MLYTVSVKVSGNRSELLTTLLTELLTEMKLELQVMQSPMGMPAKSWRMRGE